MFILLSEVYNLPLCIGDSHQLCCKLCRFYWRKKKLIWNKFFFSSICHDSHDVFFSSTIGSNVKQSKRHGDKWYKVIENNISANDCCSDLDENELTDEEDLNNNNQSLLSNYKLNESPSTSHSNCARDFFDCLRFRRNYKRNRKKCSVKGQSRFVSNHSFFIFIFLFSFSFKLVHIEKKRIVFFCMLSPQFSNKFFPDLK